MKKLICKLPWTHVHPMPSGKVYLCCKSVTDDPVGDTTSTLSDILISDNMDLVRSNMLNGIYRPACNRCADLKENPELYEFYKSKTSPEGSIDQHPLDFLNIRYSNLCNFACRSCSPEHSSTISMLANKKVHVINNIIKLPSDDELLAAKKINFAGGESMIIPEHWAVLDRLDKLNKHDVEITFVTNLSFLEYKNKNIIDYAKKFKNFKLVPSIDAYGARAEYYRHGTKWETIVKNLSLIAKESIDYEINITVGATNIFKLTKLHRILLNILTPEGKKFVNLMPLSFAPYLSCKILPTHFKSLIAADIQQHITFLAQSNYDCQGWAELVDFMMSEKHTHLMFKFFSFHFKLDKERNENLLQTFPELLPLFEFCKNSVKT